MPKYAVLRLRHGYGKYTQEEETMNEYSEYLGTATAIEAEGYTRSAQRAAQAIRLLVTQAGLKDIRIQELEAATSAVPQGYKLVPVEPTYEMLDNVDEDVGGNCCACTKWNASHDDCRRVYAAMLAAALPPPEVDGRKTVSIMCGKEAVFPIDILGGPMREYEPGKWENAVWPSAVSVLNTPVPKGYVLVSEEALRTLGVLDAISDAAAYPRKSDFATTYPNGGVAAMPVSQPPKT